MQYFRELTVALALITATPAFSQGTEVTFGGMKQDTSLPIEVSADTLSVNQTDGTALYSGDVIIGQGEMRLSAEQVLVVYSEDNRRIERLEASGGVTLVNGEEAAEADNADYNVQSGTVVMTGDVLLTQGPNALTSQRMVVNLDTGTASMEGRVRTVLQTGDN